MTGYFTNSKLGKSVTIPDIMKEYMNYSSYNNFYKEYIVSFKQTTETDTPDKIRNLLDFPIENIKITTMVVNEQGETEEKVIREITDIHQLRNISSGVDTDQFIIVNTVEFRE